MSLYKNPKSQFLWCRFKVRGITYRCSTGETDRRRAEEEEIRLRAQKLAEVPSLRRGVGSLSTLATDDIERAVTEKKVSKVYETGLTQMWARVLEAIGVDDPIEVTADLLKAYVKERRHNKIRGQTIIRELFALKRALNAAQKKDWIKALPDFPRVSSDPKDPKQRGKEHDPWVAIAVLSTVPDDVREAATVCLGTGLRFQELKRLRYDWVRPAPAGARVPAMLVLPEECTKSRQERVVGLPRWVYDILKDRANKCDGDLFPRAGYRKALARACERLEYGRVVTLRDMRHTFASGALRSGGNIADIAKALGHKKLDTTWHYLSAGTEGVLNLAADD